MPTSVQRADSQDKENRRHLIPDAEKTIFEIPPRVRFLTTSPTQEEISLFWEKYKETRQPKDQVFIATEHIWAESLLDACEAPIPLLSNTRGEAALFFIDQDPRANWGHECKYVLILNDRRVVFGEHSLPPSDSIELTPLSEAK